MQSRIEGYVPYNDNLYEKIVLFMMSGDFSWRSGATIDLLMHYGTIHVKFTKTRFILGIIWKCNSCSMKICGNHRETRNKFRDILLHIGISELPDGTLSGSSNRNNDLEHTLKISPKFRTIPDRDHALVMRKLNEENNINEYDKLSIIYKSTIYLSVSIICMACGSMAGEYIRPANEILSKHYLEHIISDMNAGHVKCCGDDNKNGEKE